MLPVILWWLDGKRYLKKQTNKYAAQLKASTRRLDEKGNLILKNQKAVTMNEMKAFLFFINKDICPYWGWGRLPSIQSSFDELDERYPCQQDDILYENRSLKSPCNAEGFSCHKIKKWQNFISMMKKQALLCEMEWQAWRHAPQICTQPGNKVTSHHVTEYIRNMYEVDHSNQLKSYAQLGRWNMKWWRTNLFIYLLTPLNCPEQHPVQQDPGGKGCFIKTTTPSLLHQSS